MTSRTFRSSDIQSGPSSSIIALGSSIGGVVVVTTGCLVARRPENNQMGFSSLRGSYVIVPPQRGQRPPQLLLKLGHGHGGEVHHPAALRSISAITSRAHCSEAALPAGFCAAFFFSISTRLPSCSRPLSPCLIAASP